MFDVSRADLCQPHPGPRNAPQLHTTSYQCKPQDQEAAPTPDLQHPHNAGPSSSPWPPTPAATHELIFHC